MGQAEAARRHRQEGLGLLQRGLLVAAAEAFRRWLALVEPTGDPQQVLPPLNALATACQARLDHEAALAWLDRAVPLASDPRACPLDVARVHINRMVSLAKLNRHQEAVAAAEAARAALAGTSAPQLLGLLYLNLSMVFAQCQEWVQVRRAAQLALDQFAATGDPECVADALVNLAVAHLELGAYRLARRDLQRALNLYRPGDPRRAYVYTELGRLAEVEGNLDAAFAAGAQALDCLLADLSPLDKEEVAKVSELFGGLFAAAGERNLALKYLNRSAAYYSQLGRLPQWQRVTGRIGQVLTQRVRPGGAPLRDQVQRLDFLTALLDLTDEIETVDPYLRGHSERVACLAVIIGREVGLGEQELRLVNYAGRLHDVGKIAVDVEILRKPGPLTQAEWERVRIHPVIGEEMMRPYGLHPEGLKAIRHHHEHWDGRGYPDGLRGEEIPLLARIIAVADVYDALTSDRVYRQAMGHAEALALMQDMAGTQLDPRLVEVLVRLHRL